MVFRYSENSDWGEMFGLHPKDLELWQLEKINIAKLVEFAPIDPRAEHILADRIAVTTEFEEIERISKLYDDEFNKLEYLKLKYNECIAINSDKIEEAYQNKWNFRRNKFVWWNRLSSGNKSQEFNRWLLGKSSIIRPNLIDYNWLIEEHPYLIDSVIAKVLKEEGARPITKMIPQLPKKYLLKYINQIFEQDKYIYAHALSNEHTPHSYVIKALRAIAGRKKVPSIKVELNKAVLEKLPTVMRLKVLESLLIYMRGGNVTFSDIKCESDLTPLLFGTAIKYNHRVQNVVKRFNYLCT